MQTQLSTLTDILRLLLQDLSYTRKLLFLIFLRSLNMIKSSLLVLSFLALSTSNCTTKKIKPQKNQVAEKDSRSHYSPANKLRSGANHQIKASDRLPKRKTLEKQTITLRKNSNKVGDISHLLPNLTPSFDLELGKSNFFPITKEFPEQEIKLVIKPGDNQKLERANKQQLAHVENISFNLSSLN